MNSFSEYQQRFINPDEWKVEINLNILNDRKKSLCTIKNTSPKPARYAAVT